MELPIVRVTCLEDRAQVERRGELELAAGAQRVRIEPIAPVAVDRSLKVELTGATLVDARIVRAFKPRPPGGLREDASALRRRVHSLKEELTQHHDASEALSARIEVARNAIADEVRSISEAAGAGTADSGGWSEQLRKLWDEEERAQEQLRQERRAVAATSQRLEEAQLAVVRAEQPEEELTTAIELSIEAAAACRAPVRISYLVPCAVWRPAYRATLKRGQDGAEKVELEADAVVWQRTGEDWRGVELALSTARPTLGANPPVLVDDRLTTREKTEAERQTVEVSIREEEIQTTGEGGKARARELPGLDDGGEARLLSAPERVTLPSDGQPHRAHLFHFEAPAKSEWTCTPEQSPLASLIARFENAGSGVLLAGPVELVRESGFIGRGQLKFAAVGETVKLSFGSEDAVRVVRDVQEKTSESKLTGRRTSQRTVRLFVSNAGGRPLRLALLERIPVSEIASVDVRFLDGEARPAPASVGPDGIVRFDLALAERATQEVRFAYEVSASAKVVGL